MMKGIWGKKVGMTQLFTKENKVVPVTAIDTSLWVIANVKTATRDGYSALQIGRLRDDYQPKDFSADWSKKPQKYYSVLREVELPGDEHEYKVGQSADVASILNSGENVDVVGLSIGRGFQGAVKRHGFTGGRASHGSKLGRSPGSLSFMRRQGRVIKGKRLPGHMGVEQSVMKNLQIVKVEPESQMIFIKGSVPGKSGSLVFLRKRG